MSALCGAIWGTGLAAGSVVGLGCLFSAWDGGCREIARALPEPRRKIIGALREGSIVAVGGVDRLGEWGHVGCRWSASGSRFGLPIVGLSTINLPTVNLSEIGAQRCNGLIERTDFCPKLLAVELRLTRLIALCGVAGQAGAIVGLEEKQTERNQGPSREEDPGQHIYAPELGMALWAILWWLLIHHFENPSIRGRLIDASQCRTNA